MKDLEELPDRPLSTCGEGRRGGSLATVALGLVVALVASLTACGGGDDGSANALATAAESPSTTTSPTPDPDDGSSAFPMIPERYLDQGTAATAKLGHYGPASPLTRDDLAELYKGITVACGPKPIKGLPEPIRALKTTLVMTKAMTGGRRRVTDAVMLEFTGTGPVEQITAGLNGCWSRGGAAYGALNLGRGVFIQWVPFRS